MDTHVPTSRLPWYYPVGRCSTRKYPGTRTDKLPDRVSGQRATRLRQPLLSGWIFSSLGVLSVAFNAVFTIIAYRLGYYGMQLLEQLKTRRCRPAVM